MPTYQNNSKIQSTIGTLTLAPGQIGTSNEWFLNSDLTARGWTETSGSPSYNPFITSVVITSSGAYNVPQSLSGNYQITFFCSTGSIAVYLNEIGIPRNIVAGEKYSISCLSRIVNSISWIISSGTASFTVEQN